MTINTLCSQELSLHDAELVAIAVDRANSIARLSFLLQDGALHIAELRGLKAFRCEDLTLQNVVSRALQSSQKQLSSEDLDYWVMWVTSLSDASSWLSEKHKQDWLTDCMSGTLELVVFEPSAGAQAVAVCEQFVLT